MPAKNVVKQYQENGFYHIYNRGVEKRKIFLDERDYKTFLFFLKIYLLDTETLKKEFQENSPDNSKIERDNFAGDIDLLAYCLMPNHFHLLLKQKSIDGISRFMKCIATNYSMYFNKRYERVGKLFQGVFKAVLVKNDNYLLYLSKYIHLNYLKKICKGVTLVGKKEFKMLEDYGYSSYQDYLGGRHTKWVKPDLILDFFKTQKNAFPGDIFSYQNFIEDIEINSEEIIGDLAIDLE